MALFRIDHTPENIKVNIPLNIIIPDPTDMKDIPVRERKILYLLHGLSDDSSAWQRYSSIETYAREYGLVVVMPSAGRSFYIDQPNGQKYFTYLVEELPHYLEEVFGIAPNRENTFIAGLSMGGYGAFKAALLHPERYFAAASFSGVLSLSILSLIPDKEQQVEFTQLFGDLDKLAGSIHDPAIWVKTAMQMKKPLPHLYIACGKQDDLYPMNTQYYQYCQAQGLEVEYHEEDGKHDWLFWDRQMQRFITKLLQPII